jgi:uncharacterized protein with NRDE domain
VCTVLLLLRPNDRWPLLIGANRDERRDRPFDPPGRYWPDAPGIVGGRDVLGGGSWFGVNDDGVVATIVNGMQRLGPLAGKASRGELVVQVLRERDAAAAARVAGAIPADRYRGFTLLIADRRSAFAVTCDEHAVTVAQLAPGHHMVTPDGFDIPSSPRFAAYFEALRAASPPAPDAGDWSSWTDLLKHTDDDDPHRAMTVTGVDGFGTVSSTLLALPSDGAEPPVLLFAAGPPSVTPYEPVRSPWVHAARIEGG